MPNVSMERLLVQAVLKSPQDLEWSVQGLGMLRTYLSDAVRLHIWDSRFRIPNVSPIHNHPWDMVSEVVAGVLRQHRYIAMKENDPYTEILNSAEIKCGENAFVIENLPPLPVYKSTLEEYTRGQRYSQHSYEIHESLPEDGTVTLVHRFFRPNRDVARVFWRENSDWVDAKPRPATREEVEAATKYALDRWF